MEEIEFSELVGKTIIAYKKEIDELHFDCSDGTQYIMYHEQDCCENVSIDDINGDLDDLLNSPVLMAEEVSNFELSDEDKEKEREANSWGSCTWTFYKIATSRGYVTIRWYGESNGYYSESVFFKRKN